MREVPVRLRDLPADIFSRDAVPPAQLRRRVARTSSRSEYVATGERLAASLLEFVARHAPGRTLGDVLDFGCGSGRVARHVALRVSSLTGVDVDANAVAWCARHLGGRFLTIDPEPPTPLEESAFDLIYAVSVFTHFDEDAQEAWLAELHRLCRPDGFLLASTHSPHLRFERPDLTIEEHQRLNETGFLFAPGGGEFNSHSTFHAPDYLRTHWSRWFDLVAHEQHGLAGYQDLALFRRR